MSIELIDKEVSTEEIGFENVDKKEVQDQNAEEKEKKEEEASVSAAATEAGATNPATTEFGKLEAILSALVESKVTSIRNCDQSNVKEKNFFFGGLRGKLKDSDKSQNEGNIPKIRTHSAATLVSPSCTCDCHRSRCKSLVPCEPARDLCIKHQTLSKFRQTSLESAHHHAHSQHRHFRPPNGNQINQFYPQQSFESYDPSVFYKPEKDRAVSDKKKFPVQKCLPKQLSTEQWLNSTTSRQASTETATTSSGYISPTFGTDHRKRYRHVIGEVESPHQAVHDSTETGSNGDSETIIELSKIQPQKTLNGIEESKFMDEMLSDKRALVEKVNNSVNSKTESNKCNDTCRVLLPQCLSTTCLLTCRCPSGDERGCQGGAPYRHLHPSGGHYMSCYNSPTHSFSKFQYDENYLTLVMNLEDLEFEQEEERRKRRKKRKKRRKERQIRSRGLMADELKSVKNASKALDPEDLPKRARWTIVATACLLLLMSMLLVGVTLRMAPIIDEMVRKENEEMLHSFGRQLSTSAPGIPAPNGSKILSSTMPENSTNRL